MRTYKQLSGAIIALILAMTPVIAQAGTGMVPEKISVPSESAIYKDLNRIPTPLTIESVADGKTLYATDKNLYQLSSIYIPETAQDFEPRTKDELSTLTIDQKCTTYITRNDDTGRVNRMNHNLVHLECGNDRIWVNAQLVRDGLAIVWPNTSNPEWIDDLYRYEATARAEKKGLWGGPIFAVQSPDSIGNHMNTRQIVEGTIYNVAMVKNNVFLNFSPDWKTDFTIGIPASLRRDFAKKNINLQSLKGTKIQVRGWVRDYNGPFIELETVQQLVIPDRENVLPLGNINDEPQPDAGMHTIKNPTPPAIEKPNSPQPPEIDPAPKAKIKANIDSDE